MLPRLLFVIPKPRNDLNVHQQGVLDNTLWFINTTGCCTAATRTCSCLPQHRCIPKVCLGCLVMSDSFQPHGLCLPGSSVHGKNLARILAWVSISYSRRSSRPMDQTCISDIFCAGRQVFYYTTRHLVLKVACPGCDSEPQTPAFIGTTPPLLER